MLKFYDERNCEQLFRRKSSKLTYYQARLNYSSSKAWQIQIKFVKQNLNNSRSHTSNHLTSRSFSPCPCRRFTIFDYRLFVVKRTIENLFQYSSKIILSFRCFPFTCVNMPTSKIIFSRINIITILKISKHTFNVNRRRRKLISNVSLWIFLASKTPWYISCVTKSKKILD